MSVFDFDGANGLTQMLAAKSEFAMTKILHYHRHIDVLPFLEWDLKLLPFFVDWFDKATSCVISHTDCNSSFQLLSSRNQKATKARLDARKLSSINQFIRAMPIILQDNTGEATYQKQTLVKKSKRGILVGVGSTVRRLRSRVTALAIR